MEQCMLSEKMGTRIDLPRCGFLSETDYAANDRFCKRLVSKFFS
jgi:hypothetical protein